MKKLFLSIILVFVCFTSLVAQNKLNKYPAVLIPKQFNFQTEPGEYNLNTIIKSSFTKYNFKAYINGEDIPDNIDPCDVLHLDVSKKGLLVNKMSLIFNDCYGKEIYTSIEGKSRLKEFDKSYYEAIGLALKDDNIVHHKYIPEKKVIVAQKVPTPKPVVAAIPTKTSPTPLIKGTILLELRGQLYEFVQKSKTLYEVYKDKKLLGTLKKQSDDGYQMKAGTLSGAGKFDDFGNFILTRVNPANQAIITDTLVRVN